MKKIIVAINKEDLQEIILQEMALRGNYCNLNHVDVSQVTDMCGLFNPKKLSMFKGNISKWNTSQVEDMTAMFLESDFNGDISKWNVGAVKGMDLMFRRSFFNGNISQWNVSKVVEARKMFENSDFKGDVTSWKPFDLKDSYHMFESCSAPIPYWFEYDNPEDLVKGINAYHLAQSLNNELKNKSSGRKLKL